MNCQTEQTLSAAIEVLNGDDSMRIEAIDMFMRLKEKDVYPYYKAEECARRWIGTWGLLGKVLNAAEILEMYDNGKVYPEVREFFKKRLENMYWSNS